MRTQSSSSYFKFKCGILICWTVINFCCAFATCCRLRSAAKLALAFSFAVLSALSLSCSLDLGWLVNSCKRIKYLANRRHRVGIAKYIHAFFRFLFSEGKYIDGQSRKKFACQHYYRKSCALGHWRPKTGHWCRRDWIFWAVAETCCHYPHGCCWVLRPN